MKNTENDRQENLLGTSGDGSEEKASIVGGWQQQEEDAILGVFQRDKGQSR